MGAKQPSSTPDLSVIETSLSVATDTALAREANRIKHRQGAVYKPLPTHLAAFSMGTTIAIWLC